MSETKRVVAERCAAFQSTNTLAFAAAGDLGDDILHVPRRQKNWPFLTLTALPVAGRRQQKIRPAGTGTRGFAARRPPCATSAHCAASCNISQHRAKPSESALSRQKIGQRLREPDAARAAENTGAVRLVRRRSCRQGPDLEAARDLLPARPPLRAHARGSRGWHGPAMIEIGRVVCRNLNRASPSQSALLRCPLFKGISLFPAADHAGPRDAAYSAKKVGTGFCDQNTRNSKRRMSNFLGRKCSEIKPCLAPKYQGLRRRLLHRRE